MNPLNSSLQQFSRRASMLTLLLGSVVILGWILEIPELKSLIPGLVTMKVNTALCFIFAGGSLRLWHFVQRGCLRKSVSFDFVSKVQGYRLSLSLAIIVALIGLLTLIQDLFQINLAIDQLLFADDDMAVSTSIPGRMAPNTALSFLFLGSALILLYRQVYAVAQLLALGAACIGSLGFLGYLYGLNSLYNLSSYTAMALHTCVGFLLFSIAILLACPNQGWIRVITSQYAGSLFVRRLLPMILIIPIVLGGVFLYFYREFPDGAEVGFVVRSIVNILLLGGLLGWQAEFLNQLDQQRQQTEQELRQSYQELEQRVQERTLQLAESRRQLSNLINTLPGIVFVRHSHPNFSMHYISQGCLSLTGYSIEDLTGCSSMVYNDLIHPEDLPDLLTTIQQAITYKKSYRVEYRILNRFNQEKWFWEQGNGVWNELGEMVSLEGFITDISDRKQAEFDLSQLNQELEQRVKQRTSELQLINQELEAFCYSVSHDLRAPLRNIDGFSQVLLERFSPHLGDQGQHYLSRIRASVQRMAELIEDLLALSRVSRTELQQTSVNLTAIAEEIAQTLTETEPRRRVQWQISPGIVTQGDRRLLQVVLENLLNNAWKFTSHRPEAEIEFNQGIHPETGELIYWVKDNGAGFNMAYAHKLFGVFQRLHSLAEFPGTGIGLATVQRIIHRHGGRVWAEGIPDQGAIFYFSL